MNICYCRVSSQKQKEDLNRQIAKKNKFFFAICAKIKNLQIFDFGQIQFMKLNFPNYEIIYDIASGLNYNRKGLRLIINYAINNEINELIIAYKDRLTRFGFELSLCEAEQRMVNKRKIKWCN